MDSRRLITIAVGAVVIIGALFLIYQFFNWIGDINTDETQVARSEQVDLAASADTALVTRITTSGEIKNKEDYNSIRISISRSKRTLEILKGYDNVPVEVVRFDNSQAAFESFLLALELRNFTESKEGAGNDERGYCATGTRTVYEVIGNTDYQQRLWSGSCNKKIGTFNGDSKEVKSLFQAQIPDYSSLVRGVSL